jgi:hypothetical protein
VYGSKNMDKVSLAVLQSHHRGGSRCCFLGENKNGRREDVATHASSSAVMSLGCGHVSLPSLVLQMHQADLHG